MDRKILMISAEASGDLHGSSLIKALKRLSPSIVIKGMGGEKMIAAGLSGIDSTKLSVVGIVEVFRKFPAIVKAFLALKKLLKEEIFDCVVLIDYPDFNLRFAKAAKKRGLTVVYYISPQIWAWRKKRIFQISRVVDKMLVVFPFEEALYREAGLDVEYVGHPVADIAVCGMSNGEAKEALGIAKDTVAVALLPGSRTEELRRHLMPMVSGVKLLQQRLGTPVCALILAAPGIEEGLVKELLKDSPPSLKIKVITKNTYTLLRAADIAAVASGTATLETALIGTPMVIVYRMSVLSYLIAKLLVSVDYIGLPNIISGNAFLPELIQGEVTPPNIAEELYGLLKNPGKQRAVKEGYERIKKDLAGKGAPERAARAVFRLIGESPLAGGEAYEHIS